MNIFGNMGSEVKSKRLDRSELIIYKNNKTSVYREKNIPIFAL